MDEKQLRQSIGKVLDEARGVLYGGARSTIDDLLDAGEIRVAAEILCDNLCDCEVRLSASAYEELISVAKELGLTPNYWSHLPTPGTPA